MSDCVRWTIARQAHLSMGFSTQEYWSGLPFPSLGDLPDPGTELESPVCMQILYRLSHQESHVCVCVCAHARGGQESPLCVCVVCVCARTWRPGKSLVCVCVCVCVCGVCVRTHVEAMEARWVGGVQRRWGFVLTPMKGMNF